MGTSNGPGDLPTTWRERAAFLQQFGDPTAARLWQLAAVELKAALKALGDKTLTLVEAVALSGYSADHLGYLVRHGKLTNHGRNNAPRVRRAAPHKRPSRTLLPFSSLGCRPTHTWGADSTLCRNEMTAQLSTRIDRG